MHDGGLRFLWAFFQLVAVWMAVCRVLLFSSWLTMQANCFHFDSHRGRTRKLKYRILPDRTACIPIFQHEGVDVSDVCYHLTLLHSI